MDRYNLFSYIGELLSLSVSAGPLQFLRALVGVII